MGENDKLFGTDGIRGVANRPPLTPALALAAGRAFGVYLREKATENPRDSVVVIGRDTRLSGHMLEAAVTAGLTAAGVNVRLAGVVPTPAVAALCRSLPAAGGVVISASHNPFEDNGLKFFQAEGLKLNDDAEAFLEKRIRQFADDPDAGGIAGTELGGVETLENAADQYTDFALQSLPTGLRLEGLRIAADCANGAACRTTPLALRRLGADVEIFHCEPDGLNINEKCGSTFPGEIARIVKETGAHAGISHDGDADRVVLCDETGSVLDGDELLAIAAASLLNRGELVKNTLVATVMSNFGLEKALEPHNGKVVRTKVGDRQVLEEMLSGGYNLGGEQSGHVIFRDYHSTGDGLISALQVLRIMQETGEPLSQLRKVLTKYPQEQRNVRVTRKPPIESLEDVQKAREKAQVELGNTGRVLLRYSGTEPKLRILVEGRDARQIAVIADRLAAAVKKELGDGS